VTVHSDDSQRLCDAQTRDQNPNRKARARIQSNPGAALLHSTVCDDVSVT